MTVDSFLVYRAYCFSPVELLEVGQGPGDVSFARESADRRVRILTGLAESIDYSGVKGFFLANFWTGPGLTGWIMTIILWAMIWFAMEKRKRANFERFWYTHHVRL